ncbi:MAG TPA: hypothetical protein VEY69_13450 [Lautropia sp.]|jgi:hypothetical protein|nr:hypothetical protein [Lautropia sp.]
MTPREQNNLIKKLKSLSPEEILSVQQFLDHLLPAGAVSAPADASPLADGRYAAADPPPNPFCRPPQATNPDAEIAQAAGAGWRRQPFQAVDADDLQPIAALFRQALDSRAASRFRYGSR